MVQGVFQQTGVITETLRGIVQRVTYHNPANGWTVLRVSNFDHPGQQETVIVHQTKVFAGATMEFQGAWTQHPTHGRQFQAAAAVEKKPATSAALEKYLGSGLIKGVGPKTARKIVRYFGSQTLSVFEADIGRLTEVAGIARKKLDMIREAWSEHRAIREVMMFLQSHGISTLFAVRIYKAYGDNAIAYVTDDPYRLANDFYGIGFFSADKVALSIGLQKDSPQRIMAAVKHVLADSRQMGHCYLTRSQIDAQTTQMIDLNISSKLTDLLERMEADGLLMRRNLITAAGPPEPCYYAKSLYYDELYVARRVAAMTGRMDADQQRINNWLERYCRTHDILLSPEQMAAVGQIANCRFAILTGGPGCGKTTATGILVQLLGAMGRKVMLAAPTGRAAQRMMDVIGREAKTIHRLLEWHQDRFKKNDETPLEVDFLIVDECSMLDISLTAALLKAVPLHGQVLFIGDADQLPSVGAGNVLKDLMASGKVPVFALTRIFRQAERSLIVQFAHQINAGELPHIDSPFHSPEIWHDGRDCLFLDSDEATQEQMHFIGRVKRFFEVQESATCLRLEGTDAPYRFRTDETMTPFETELTVPSKFQHVDLEAVVQARDRAAELAAVIKKVHPWSSLRYGLTATDIVQRLYLQWIPKYLGSACEIQVLCPMTRGSLGTLRLNSLLQKAANPARGDKAELMVGERIFRVGDRVIHRQNNYDLNVFNGDIGRIEQIDNQELTCVVSFDANQRQVQYRRDDIVQLDLAYAITIHKSQGSEFAAVIMPVLSQHYKMLFRNLIYTGLTRARKLAVLVGTRKALAIAVHNQDTRLRQTALKELLTNR
jgi:exodeoxyribonuclease V alpha subunit